MERDNVIKVESQERRKQLMAAKGVRQAHAAAKRETGDIAAGGIETGRGTTCLDDMRCLRLTPGPGQCRGAEAAEADARSDVIIARALAILGSSPMRTYSSAYYKPKSSTRA
ncbi:hypothetical protein AXG93_3522s1120 [Marchantia polymorpha subsp. ruderalis]|uniref:Uncharacterized protein n=1 Tax=Marchantia polymorpha subsp. ruderalis TaxID=1480154 RepID=A0A176WEL1_MARPO|nr:hypothetical protein AXG93_3522s1120 [Marchantia polymorpha subsp. ruderalis]